MYEVSSSPENGNEFYSFASDFNPLLPSLPFTFTFAFAIIALRSSSYAVVDDASTSEHNTGGAESSLRYVHMQGWTKMTYSWYGCVIKTILKDS